jgi:exopolysaccharide/PEP-CTERM locus tyrosine autokinase
MSIDLIKRATERMAKAGQVAAPAQPLPTQPQPQAAAAPPPPTAVPPASGLSMPGIGDHAPILPSPAGPPRTSKFVKLDMDRLRRLGVITPNTPETTQIAEEFRIIKRPLLLRAFGEAGSYGHTSGNNHLIMVTSARPGEGKTFVSLNLAMSMASEQNMNVLLIDADVKNPSLPRLLGIETGKGLIDVLTDDNLDLADVILRTEVNNLSFLPAGRPHAQSTELFAGRTMAGLVQDIARRYSDRVVIFDAPPVLASSEPGVLALHVGQLVFVVESEVTSRRAVDEALSHLKGCENLNLVLNKSRPWLGRAQFGTYYGYPER